MKATHFLLLTVLLGCSEPKPAAIEQPISPIEKPASLASYWHKGCAEISSYALEQARYGEIRTGTAVTIFVTEPFSRSKQVKLDDYKAAGDDKVSILKLNMTKNFVTGIYPYSMMLSTFTPMDGAPMIKSATSSQEWCGHTFMQVNRQDSGYRWTGFSYFESEGDATGQFSGLSEDQVWTTLRLDPARLPVGEVTLLPSTFYLRLKHRPVASVMAKAALSDVSSSDYSTTAHQVYELTYPDRSLRIFFESTLPYEILGWEETYKDGSADLTTKAKLKKRIRSEYWQKNNLADTVLRKELGL